MLSAYLRDRLLEHFLRGQAYPQPEAVYASLHISDPGQAGSAEVEGDDYRRQVATDAFQAAKGGLKATLRDLDFTSMPAVAFTHAGLWDARRGGNFLVGGPLRTPAQTNRGDTYRLPAGELIASLM